MDVYVLFGRLPQRYAGEYAPDPLGSYSEYMFDGDTERMHQAIEEDEKKFAGQGYKEFRTVRLRIDGAKLDELFKNEVPQMHAEIVKEA